MKTKRLKDFLIQSKREALALYLKLVQGSLRFLNSFVCSEIYCQLNVFSIITMIFCSFQDLEEGKQATINSGGIRIQVFTFYFFMKLSAFHNSIPCWVTKY